ncbi:uncharacterized protein [Cardiocondyla obscurior]|uniref:uncharacterized protein n=1 Tax=Cardiocondyla obscurior TaxID=286306 RepID=UPI003965649F
MLLNHNVQEDLSWWHSNILHRISSLEIRNYSLTIFSDASLTGWGCSCGNDKAHGFWKESELIHHINYLELLAALFSFKCFAKDLTNSNILLRLDNTTAISYINRIGGIRFKKLSDLSKIIWIWCEERELFIFASYIPSEENEDADFESRRSFRETEFELANEIFKKIVVEFGQPNIDLFASRSNSKCSVYVSWARDPNAVTIDAFTFSWKKDFFYAFPPFILIPKVLQKIRSDEAEDIVVVPQWKTSPSQRIPYAGGRDIIGEAFKLKGFPEDSLSIAISSLSESSFKQYEGALKKWWFFCLEKKLNLFSTNISEVLSFLSKEYEKGASYGTLNSLRSAISLISSVEIGQNKLIKRFFKGIAMLRPPKPKYSETWDPQLVLSYFRNLGSDNVPLECLSKKLIMLLALVTEQRIQTLASINIDQILVREDAIYVRIPDRIKTSKPGNRQPLLCLPKPFKKVSTPTLSRWVKDILKECGIDTDLFSAHSIRHAATSAAKRKGVNIDVIRKSAGWSENSVTFAKFYDRPVLQGQKSFGEAIWSKDRA